LQSLFPAPNYGNSANSRLNSRQQNSAGSQLNNRATQNQNQRSGAGLGNSGFGGGFGGSGFGGGNAFGSQGPQRVELSCLRRMDTDRPGGGGDSNGRLCRDADLLVVAQRRPVRAFGVGRCGPSRAAGLLSLQHCCACLWQCPRPERNGKLRK